MEKYVIRGGKPLVGDVNIGGAKNAAVAILPATILAGGKCLIENLPCISDVMASLQILSELGASIRMVSRSTYEIDTSHLDSTEVSNDKAGCSGASNGAETPVKSLISPLRAFAYNPFTSRRSHSSIGVFT